MDAAAMLNPMAMSHLASQQKDEELSKVTRSLLSTESRLKKLESSQSSKSSNPSSGSSSAPLDPDWTKSYGKWDLWQDVDEVRSQLDAERARQEALIASQRSLTGCGSHDRSAERRVVDMTTEERLGHMRKFAEDGNTYYEEGQYARAGIKYKRALIYFEYCFPETPALELEVDAVRLSCLSNSAAAFLKTRQYEEALESTRLALDVDPRHAKSLYRRAVVHRVRDDFEKAREDLDKLEEVAPGNKAARAERLRVRRKERAYENSRKAMGAKMFRKDGGGGGEKKGGEDKESCSADDSSDDSDDASTKPRPTQFRKDCDSILPLPAAPTRLVLDDLFVPLPCSVDAAEEVINMLSGINLMDTTTLRNLKALEERGKGDKRGGGAGGALKWAFRHAASCECKEGTEGAVDDYFEDDDEEGWGWQEDEAEDDRGKTEGGEEEEGKEKAKKQPKAKETKTAGTEEQVAVSKDEYDRADGGGNDHDVTDGTPGLAAARQELEEIERGFSAPSVSSSSAPDHVPLPPLPPTTSSENAAALSAEIAKAEARARAADPIVDLFLPPDTNQSLGTRTYDRDVETDNCFSIGAKQQQQQQQQPTLPPLGPSPLQRLVQEAEPVSSVNASSVEWAATARAPGSSAASSLFLQAKADADDELIKDIKAKANVAIFVLAAVVAGIVCVKQKLPTPVLIFVGACFGHFAEKHLKALKLKDKVN